MQTVIVRVRQVRSDLLADLEVGPSPDERAQKARREREEFLSRTEGLRGILDEHRATRERYAGLLSEYEQPEESRSLLIAPHLDLLSSDTRLESGVLHYEPLVASWGYAVTASEDVLDRLAHLPEVEKLHSNYIYDIPPPETDLLAEFVPSAWHLARIGAPAAWSRSRGESVRIAVLDTGLDASHQEFAATHVAGYAEWTSGGSLLPSAEPRDTDRHGTYVAGLLCGKNVGVAPEIELYVGVVAPSGRTTFLLMDKGIEWAATNGVDIISMSVGRPGYEADLVDMIDYAASKNILIVAAIGNDGVGNHRSPGDYMQIFSAGATDGNNNVWHVSATKGSGGGTVQSGNQTYLKPDIYAPGANVHSCIPGNSYGSASGTSLATPLVAGVAALVKRLQPSMNADVLRQHVLQHTRPIVSPPELGSTGLFLSAADAVAAA